MEKQFLIKAKITTRSWADMSWWFNYKVNKVISIPEDELCGDIDKYILSKFDSPDNRQLIGFDYELTQIV